MIVLDCKDFQIGQFIVPPFTLIKGEIFNLGLYGGGHFFDLEHALVAMFTGKVKQEGIQIYNEFQFADRISQSGFKNRFFPDSVGDYIKKHG